MLTADKNVRLISYSQAADYNDDLQNIQELIAFCARVSNPSNQFNSETSEKLISYLIKHQHWSPLEMVSACLEITTTRDIARQILRHRSFSFQEFSQRYADPTKDLTFMIRETRMQDKANRQNSIEFESDSEIMKNENNRLTVIEWKKRQQQVIDAALSSYKWAVDHGIAKEQARAVLPEGLTMSRMYMNGTLRSWVHYVILRTDKSTQKEHRDIALGCAKAIASVFPLIYKIQEGAM